MSQLQRQLARANAILRELDGLFPNKIQTAFGLRETQGTPQRFKWCQARDLITLLPDFDADGNFVYDYICGCGKNKTIHAPTCDTFIIPRARFSRAYVMGPLMSDSHVANSWFLCRWEPPPSREEWEASMCSHEDYPSNGRYIPVSKGIQYVHTSEPPTEELSQIVVRMMRAHAETWKADLSEEKDLARARRVPRYDDHGNVIEPAHRSSPFHNVKDALKDAMTVGGHAPGTKDDVLIFSEPSKKETNASQDTNP